MTCAWIDCTEPRYAKGVCSSHYTQTLRAGRRMIRRAADARTPPKPKRRDLIEARLEDLVFLLDAGTALEFALPRVGWTPAAAEAVLRRRGDLDLARQCGRLDKAAKRAA